MPLFNLSTLPLNDQSASGFLDVGNMRVQWGSTTQAGINANTITLPAAFANTNYVLTGSAKSAGSLQTVTFGALTTTSFSVILQYNNAGTSAANQNGPFGWFAIGQKP